ncbi:hypothetical protein FQR65_LT06701 [Abscondita terminalis]|nr:hypothetical protein FQR65_LT06701 [Abscondita terminalis]
MVLTVKWNPSSACLVGKTAIVTGSNIGIGYYTALDFAKRGARVILACRNQTKAEKAKSKIINETGNKNVVVKILDLSSFKSVRKFAKEVNETEKRLDILVNNAGGGVFTELYTSDGLKSQMQKSTPSRVVTVSTTSAIWGKIDTLTLNPSFRFFCETLTYFTAKLCSHLFTIELAQRLKGTGVTANVVHPGAIKSDFFKGSPSIPTTLLAICMKMFFKSTKAGAQTSIYVAIANELDGVSGKFFVDCAESEYLRAIEDRDLAKAVWAKSEEIVKLTLEEKRCFVGP